MSTEFVLKDALDKVYKVGVKNGGILMKNKIMKSLNRDYNLFLSMNDMRLLVKILKKINKIKLNEPN